MSVETIGCPHCGEQTEITVRGDERVTEVKKDRSLLDALLVFQGTSVQTVECPEGHEFCIYKE
ncbi:hypothetical protein [Candidatus Halobonum tyrrellensis]|uniref:Uncharacterized protein n=1 Tax=Candidatus Halobonum tyrrellensis G22 TaxID=1324957 RepID=V4HGV4_9EURY|nr:hypothetical protein [Candidatus Halobonum tyrrellensis]ESP87059.1 hypothetical protein K933_16117 [Candidatus Halobonum tyrrellensis G22]